MVQRLQGWLSLPTMIGGEEGIVVMKIDARVPNMACRQKVQYYQRNKQGVHCLDLNAYRH